MESFSLRFLHDCAHKCFAFRDDGLILVDLLKNCMQHDFYWLNVDRVVSSKYDAVICKHMFLLEISEKNIETK